MKRPFQVGDRAAVYTADPMAGRRAQREVGQVREILEGGTLRLEIKGARGFVCAHPKQCRRLLPKPRRRIWVLPGVFVPDDPPKPCLTATVYTEQPVSAAPWMEFVEVRRKKRG